MKKLCICLLLASIYIASLLQTVNGCTAFYCLNSCGVQKPSAEPPKHGFKLVLAVNRDEQVDRPTLPAWVWPSKTGKSFVKKKSAFVECDQSKHDPPYDLCTYGPLDVAGKPPPEYYSTWIGINERGSTGNLLFYMQDISRNTTKGRGIIASDFLIDSSWQNSDQYMKHLMTTRLNFGPFNYVQTEMSNKTGRYSLYLITNGNNSTYTQVISDKNLGPNYFAISNSDYERPFNKVKNGNATFKALLEEYEKTLDKAKLVDGIIALLQSTTENYPDLTLAEFMKKDPQDPAVHGVSRLKANYYGYWTKGHTRTSTLILVDYQDNVEYYEYNLTNYRINQSGSVDPGDWEMNSFKFKLKPLYKNSGVRLVPGNIMTVIIASLLTGFLRVLSI